MKGTKIRVLGFLISIVVVLTVILPTSLIVCAGEFGNLKDYEEFDITTSGSGFINDGLDYGFRGSDFEITADIRTVTIQDAYTEMKPGGNVGFGENNRNPVIGKILLDVESFTGEPEVEFYAVTDVEKIRLNHKSFSNGNNRYTLVCEVPEGMLYIGMKNTDMKILRVKKAVIVRRGKTYPYEPKQEEPKPQDPKPENFAKNESSVQSSGIKENATANHTTCLRKEATTRSKALMKVKKGQKVQVLTRNRKWYKVRVGNRTGYIRAKYVSWKGRLVSARKNGNVYLKGKARASSRTVGRYKAGTRVKVIDCNGKWYKGKIGKKTGYMKIKQITPRS